MALEQPKLTAVVQVASDTRVSPGLWVWWPERSWWIEVGGQRVLNHEPFVGLYPEARIVAGPGTTNPYSTFDAEHDEDYR